MFKGHQEATDTQFFITNTRTQCFTNKLSLVLMDKYLILQPFGDLKNDLIINNN